MSTYTSFEQFEGHQLWLVKKDWWKEEYELTDNKNCYARVYQDGIFSTALNYEAYNVSIITTGSTFSDFTIKTTDEKILGYADSKLFSNKTRFKLNDSFEGDFYNPSFNTMYYVIVDSNNYQLIDFDGNGQSLISINIYRKPADVPAFDAIIFAGIRCVINRQRMLE
ncbi:hypothetical protein FFF34_006760 [Inquilinus sp. KBS0705]|nr:hypothetical protein FFF34_006760 [Inquilinus sp. KBS0705]